MKSLIILIIALPLFTLAQNKNIINSSRYFPKPDKVPQFEKALGAHAQKYHKGDMQWRVFSIETGPDAGGYHVVEGPTTWDAADKRGDLGKAHMDDWSTSVQPLLTDKSSNAYFRFRKDLSSVELTDYADKVSIEHLFFKPGYYGEIQASLTDMKKVWEEGKQSIAVFEASSSGEPQFAVSTRYKQGLKEREEGFREPFNVRFTKVHGEDAWKKYIMGRKEMLARQWSEMLFYKPDLGSK